MSAHRHLQGTIPEHTGEKKQKKTLPRIHQLRLVLSIYIFQFGDNNCLYGHWPNSQIPACPCSISHSAPFRTELCTFLFWMEHCGTCDRCILGFMKFVFWSRIWYREEILISIILLKSKEFVFCLTKLTPIQNFEDSDTASDVQSAIPITDIFICFVLSCLFLTCWKNYLEYLDTWQVHWNIERVFSWDLKYDVHYQVSPKCPLKSA